MKLICITAIASLCTLVSATTTSLQSESKKKTNASDAVKKVQTEWHNTAMESLAKISKVEVRAKDFDSDSPASYAFMFKPEVAKRMSFEKYIKYASQVIGATYESGNHALAADLAKMWVTKRKWSTHSMSSITRELKKVLKTQLDNPKMAIRVLKLLVQAAGSTIHKDRSLCPLARMVMQLEGSSAATEAERKETVTFLILYFFNIQDAENQAYFSATVLSDLFTDKIDVKTEAQYLPLFMTGLQALTPGTPLAKPGEIKLDSDFESGSDSDVRTDSDAEITSSKAVQSQVKIRPVLKNSSPKTTENPEPKLTAKKPVSANKSQLWLWTSIAGAILLVAIVAVYFIIRRHSKQDF